MREALDWTYHRYGARTTVEDLAGISRRIIDFFVPTFKHNGFVEEQEWRLIFAPLPGNRAPQFRVARNMISRYYSLKHLISQSSNRRAAKNWRLPIRGVRIGPSQNKELNALSTEALLVKAGYAGARVERSPIAYRGK